VVHHSVAFPGSAVSGLTVGEVDPESSPAQEVADLWAYISARIQKDAKQASNAASKQASQTRKRP